MRASSLKSADFQRALGTRALARTAHFSLHALPGVALVPADGAKLSTGACQGSGSFVDEPAWAAQHCPGRDWHWQHWRLGLVLPKKQARRSVTRSLLRHQAREAFRRHAPLVQASGRHGQEVAGWVLRLRAPFDRQQFPSAASLALSAAVREELDELWSRLRGARA